MQGCSTRVWDEKKKKSKNGFKIEHLMDKKRLLSEIYFPLLSVDLHF